MMTQPLTEVLVADRTASRRRDAEVRRIRRRAVAGTVRTAAPPARFRTRRPLAPSSRLDLRAS